MLRNRMMALGMVLVMLFSIWTGPVLAAQGNDPVQQAAGSRNAAEESPPDGLPDDSSPGSPDVPEDPPISEEPLPEEDSGASPVNPETELPLSEEPRPSVSPITVNDAVYMKSALPPQLSPHLEIKEARTATSKTYHLGSDTYATMISTENLHYQDWLGQWQDLSLDLTEEGDVSSLGTVPLSREALPEVMSEMMEFGRTDPEGRLQLNAFMHSEMSRQPQEAYRALQVPFDVKISKRFTEGYEVGRGHDRLGFIPLQANPVAAERIQNGEESIIRYVSAWEATDVDLQLTPSGLKETIVLTSHDAPRSFTYEVTKGELKDDFTSGDLLLEPAWLIDAEGTFREVEQRLRRDNGSLYLDLLPDVSGLVFPVQIDPTVVVRPEGGTYDAAVNAHEPGRNYGTAPRLYTGKDHGGAHFRSLLRFDLSAIPAGEYEVQDAYVTLYQTAENQYLSPSAIQVERITEDWNEATVTWNSQPGYALNLEGQAYGTAVLQGEGLQALYIKELAYEWLNGLHPNFGFMLHADDVPPTNIKKYVSANTSAMQQHPALTIQYTMPNQTWSGVTSSADALASFNQKKLDVTSDGYSWMLARDGGDFRLDALNPDTNRWHHVARYPMNASDGSMYIDQDDGLHLVYTAAGGDIGYVYGSYNAAARRFAMSEPVELASQGASAPDVVAHRTSGDGYAVHVVYAQASGATSEAIYRRLNMTADGLLQQLTSPYVLGSGKAGVPTWPSIDFHHTPSSEERGKAVKDETPHLYVAWNTGEGGGGKGIRHRKADYAGSNWSWRSEQPVDDNHFTVSDQNWFLSIYDGSRPVVFGQLRNQSGQIYTMAYTMQDVGKRLSLFQSVPGMQGLNGSGSYDAQGNLYFGGRSASDGPLVMAKWKRAAKTLAAPKVVTQAGGTSFLSMKRGDSLNQIQLVTSTPAAEETGGYNLEHSLVLDTVERHFTQYTYDEASRLTYMLLSGGDGIAFTYDKAGNLIRRERDEQPDTNGSNLLINGSFEVTEPTPGTDPGITDPNLGWMTYHDPAAKASFGTVTEPVSRGNKAYRIEANGLLPYKSAMVYQTVEVRGNEPFRLSGKLYKQQLNGSSAVLSAEFLDADLNVLGRYEQESAEINDTYQTVQSKGWIPSGTRYAKVYVYLKGLTDQGAGTVVFDEIKLEYEDDNALSNPGFERVRDSQAVGWGGYVPPGANGTFQSVPDGYEGAYGLEISVNNVASGQYAFVHQTLGIGAGEAYEATVRYRTERLTGAEGVLALQFFDENWNSLDWIEHTGSSAESYERLTLSGNAPAGAVYIKLMTGVKGTADGGNGSVFIDNAKLKLVRD